MKGKVGWGRVDCFDKFPLCEDSIRMLREDGYRICIVSPELQGQQEKLEEYAGRLLSLGYKPDAICTKLYCIEQWKRVLGI